MTEHSQLYLILQEWKARRKAKADQRERDRIQRWRYRWRRQKIRREYVAETIRNEGWHLMREHHEDVDSVEYKIGVAFAALSDRFDGGYS
ncbi:hypothetical protein SEA_PAULODIABOLI_316 [Microbacterium phage PauloDiaboli]|nr:hypothetical protein SEA_PAULODIABOLI_316 [Microbacterium phage PauloDiaboli]